MNQVKTACDVASVCGWLAALVGWLPQIAAAASLVWTIIRIYETKTVQNLVKRLREYFKK
jgi:hypothetical protein